MLKKLLHKTSEKLNQMDQTVNWPDPRFVSLQESGKDIKEFVSFDVSDKYCHSYIGKMRKDGEWIYSDEVLTALLSFFMKNVAHDKTFTIELANIVSEILNDKDNKNEYLTFEEQRKHIIIIAKKLNKKWSKKLHIVDIQENNPELFQILKEEWIQGLNNKWKKPELNPENFNSLDIAKYLYRASTKDAEYFIDLKKLKPAHLQELNWNTDYYGLIELAIRINDLLHWIIVQWWVSRQKKYDGLLLRHINPNDPEYPVLKDFKIFCAEILDKQWDKIPYWNKFRWLYFDTDKSEMLVQKIQEKEKIKIRMRGLTWITAGLLIWVLWTNSAMEYFQSQKLKNIKEETIKEIFENKKVDAYCEYWTTEYKWEEKLQKIEEYTKDIYERFLFRYGGIWDFKEKAFKTKIMDCLNNQKVLSLLWSDGGGETSCIQDRIIDEYLIPQNIWEFRINNIATAPYQNLLPYLDNFINTILLEKDFETTRNAKYKTMEYRWISTYQAVREIGEFSIKDNWYYGNAMQRYKFALTTDPTSLKQYVLATNCYYWDFEKKEYPELYTSRARDLAIDLLKQTQPVINQLLDEYLLRYYRWNNTHFINADWLEKAKLAPGIEDLLIKDFLRKWLLKKINQKQTEKIINYLDQFIIDNQDSIKKLTWDINKNLIPNGFLQEYEEAMKNTITLSPIDTVVNDYYNLPVSNFWKKPNIVDNIGRYKTSDWKLYLVGSVEINGKNYLYASEEIRPNFWEKRYNYYEGNIVALDYFKVKADFLQKKILYEKKLKSASQRHADIKEKLKRNSFTNHIKNNK